LKKTFGIILSSFVLISIISCGSKTYTVKWCNYDDSVLETDLNVKKGENPTYDGETPTKPEDELYYYDFAGWTPELTSVSNRFISMR